jgi:hypothetical protein
MPKRTFRIREGEPLLDIASYGRARIDITPYKYNITPIATAIDIDSPRAAYLDLDFPILAFRLPTLFLPGGFAFSAQT